MAIRFVDKGPENAKAEPAVPRRREPATDPHPDAPIPEDDAPPAGLTHAKPEPKPRGRKKPLSAKAKPAAPAAAAPVPPLLAGLEAQAAPEPAAPEPLDPKPAPRRRKAAFG